MVKAVTVFLRVVQGLMIATTAIAAGVSIVEPSLSGIAILIALATLFICLVPSVQQPTPPAWDVAATLPRWEEYPKVSLKDIEALPAVRLRRWDNGKFYQGVQWPAGREAARIMTILEESIVVPGMWIVWQEGVPGVFNVHEGQVLVSMYNFIADEGAA